jgi:tRNA G18 (ribose-2'-O)-methylase SpoU
MPENRKLKNDELGRLEVDDFKHVKKLPCVIVLDNIRSLNNIGSVFRTADAFRIRSIYLCGITAKPPHREIHKTALGATESVNWNYFDETKDAIAGLINEGYRIFSVEQAEQSLEPGEVSLLPGDKTALVFGHEVKGVSQEIVDMSETCIEIPQYGTKHSLNVSVSVGIVVWEFFNKYGRLFN